MAAAAKRSTRQEPPQIVKGLRRTGRALAVPARSVVLAFVAGAVIVAVTGGDPFKAYQALACGGFGLFCFRGGASLPPPPRTPGVLCPLSISPGAAAPSL